LISPIRGFGLLIMALALSGCATRSACDPGPYLEAGASPPLAVPPGLEAPPQRGALRLPDARGGGGRLASDSDNCIIEPPQFYAEPGEPNPDGLPLRPSSVVVAGSSAPAPGATRVTREVTAFLNDWSGAWTQRDFDAWLLYYDDAYAPAGYNDAAAWRDDQRSRFEIPATTRIDAGSVSVEPLPDGNARVRFVQRFGAAPEERSVVKEMILVPRTGGSLAWSIVDERIVDVL